MHYVELVKKYQDNMNKLRQKKTKEEKHPVVITEPKPGINHLICALCREQFKDYLVHIKNPRHRDVGVATNLSIFVQIDDIID